MSLFSEGVNALLAFQGGTLFCLYTCEITKFQNKVKGLETTLGSCLSFQVPVIITGIFQIWPHTSEMNSLGIPHFSMLHTEQAVTSVISHSQKQHGKLLLLLQIVSSFSMGTCVWIRRDRGMGKRRKEVKCGGVPPSASLLDSYLEITQSESSAALPHNSSCTYKAHRSCSWMWIFASHTCQIPIGSPSWQLFFQKLSQCS